MTYLFRYLKECANRYYNGQPILSDDQYDRLAESIGYKELGAQPEGKTEKHKYPMYSLQKYYSGEGKSPLADYSKPKIVTPKLDGAAVSLLYIKGVLSLGLTRGDGEEGEVITDKVYAIPTIPTTIITEEEFLQVTGEIVAPKTVKNSRNYASGALKLLSIDEFKTREVYFVAYGMEPNSQFYSTDLNALKEYGFTTVLDSEFCDNFPQDGMVVRVNSTLDFKNLGYTSSHPRGAYAIKERKQGVPTTLVSVEWQTGKSGRVTPVAVFDPVDLDGAIVTRATLNNPGFIQALDLSIGDKILVVRSGDIIPTVLGKAE